MPQQRIPLESALPDEVIDALIERGVTEQDEVALRLQFEQRVSGYNLFRLTPAAVKRWKCRYRILLDAGYYDGQSVREVYARALLAVIDGL